MRFLEIRIKNFLSYGEEQVIPLEKQGLVAVLGRNEDTQGADSNGSGKSAIFDAMVYALYGETLRGLKADDVVNRRVGKDCLVGLKVEEQDRVYEIVRTRKLTGKKKPNSLYLFVNGSDVSGGTNQITQEVIDSIVGMDRTTFTQSVLLGTGAVSFCDMTDSQQKNILDDILQLESLQRARNLVREKLTGVRNELASVNTKIEAHTEFLHNTELRRAKLVTALHSFEAERLQNKLQRVQDVVRIRIRIEECMRGESLASIEAEANALEKEHEELNVKRAKVLLENSKEIEELQANVVQLRTKMGDVLSRRNRYQDDIINANKVAGKMCPTCGQLVDGTFSEDVLRDLDGCLKSAEEELSGLKHDLANAQQALDLVQESVKVKLRKIDKALNEMTQRKLLLSTKFVKREVALNRIVELEQDALNAQLLVDELVEQDNTYTPLVAECDAEIASVKDGLRLLKHKKHRHDMHVKYLMFWNHGFSNQGIKSFMLDSVIPFLNERAQYYADILSGGDLRIEFLTQTEKKSGGWKEQFHVKVLNKNGADVYKGNSSGEKRRSDVAVGWALGDLAAARASKPMRFRGLDEPFENLDATGRSAVMRLLNEVVSDYETILCMTHNEELRDQFPNELWVTKRDGCSVIGA